MNDNDKELVFDDKEWWLNGQQVTQDEFAAARRREHAAGKIVSTMREGLPHEITVSRPLQLKPAKKPKP